MTHVWAHRGASATEPENTIPAILRAAALGAHGIEIDVQRSLDGALVVMHDETIDRTTDRTGRVVDLSLAELRQADAGTWKTGRPTPIPTLAEVLDAIAETNLRCNIELKNSIEPYPGMEAHVVEEVRASRLGGSARERIVYSSFNHRSLQRLAAIEQPAPIGALYVEQLVDPCGYAAGFGASALHPLWSSLDEADVAQAHERGMAVHVWTVDEVDTMRRMQAWGVDAIVSNDPALALATLG